MQLSDGVRRSVVLAAAGADAIEVSCNAMRLPSDSAKEYVAVGPSRALQDLLLHRVFGRPHPVAYFLEPARRLREQISKPIILVGAMRSPATMERIVERGDSHFVAMARPFIREPDLVVKLGAGRRGPVACTSCNLCLMHESHHSLHCWRVPRSRLWEHPLSNPRRLSRSTSTSPLRARVATDVSTRCLNRAASWRPRRSRPARPGPRTPRPRPACSPGGSHRRNAAARC